MKSLARDGFFKRVGEIFLSVTNVNNVSFACSAWPKEHGIMANSYFDEASGEARCMNAAEMIRAKTVFQRVARSGVRCALLTAKGKSIEFQRQVDLPVTAQEPPLEFIERYGKPAHIYSSEINHWLWKVAGDLLKNRPEFGLIYVHTTGYPCTPGPRTSPSRNDRNGRRRGTRCRLLLTADHGMNYKPRCWDLTRICEAGGGADTILLVPGA